jgi:uncharacterized protein involved in response to NO
MFVKAVSPGTGYQCAHSLLQSIPRLTQPEIMAIRHLAHAFSSAPHRMLFFTGMLQIVLVMALWGVELAGRAGLLALPPQTLAPIHGHTVLMLYGIFPFFIFGFLFTVYPRWLGGAPITARTYITVFVLLTTGAFAFDLGLYGGRVLLAAALLTSLAGWLAAIVALYRVYRRARHHSTHERLLNLALAAGAGGVAVTLAGVLGNQPPLFLVAREMGLWLFLLPVIFLVSHRMIPVFSQGTLMNYLLVRPAWSPPLMVVCVLLHVTLELGNLSAWRWLADGPLAVAALQHSWVWQFRRSFHARLLAMLHIAFLWLGIGMSLYTLQSLLLLATGTDYFGRAPLHALGLGFITGMVVAMGSRVTLGHSGQALHADTLTWLALLGLNLATVSRLASEFLPTHATPLNLLAACLWLGFLVPWVLRYAPLFLRTRVDGQPG